MSIDRTTATIPDIELYNKRPLLNPETKSKWVTALRSGKYEQGKTLLSEHNKYCCLGVLVCIRDYPIEYKFNDTRIFCYDYDCGIPPEADEYSIFGALGNFTGFYINNYDNLARLNDSGYSFEEIADIIEKHF